MQHSLYKADRTCVARVVHAARIEGDVSIAIRQSSDAHAQSCGICLDNARARLNHVHGVSTLLKGKETGRIRFHAVVPRGQHRGPIWLNKTRS